MCKEHNGWTNYQTWCVKLWLDNDEELYESALEIARNSKGEDSPRSYIKENLQEHINCYNPLSDGASMFTDLLGYALETVNWFAIADAYLEEVADEDADESFPCYYCAEETDGEFQDEDGDYVCEECLKEDELDETGRQRTKNQSIQEA